jgi:hypothetical protein
MEPKPFHPWKNAWWDFAVPSYRDINGPRRYPGWRLCLRRYHSPPRHAQHQYAVNATSAGRLRRQEILDAMWERD